jgi:hypothetical protein
MVRITESQELPITSGTLEVDSSKGSIMIHLVSGHPEERLTIHKVSGDAHSIVLYGDTSKIDGNDIVIFGLALNSKLPQGRTRTVRLVSDGTHWSLQ